MGVTVLMGSHRIKPPDREALFHQWNNSGMSPLDPNDLLLFARVVEQGSFTAAATALGCPKSTLSRRLSALEAQLGERLLLRSTRRLSLTEFGQAVLDHAQQVVADTAAAWDLAQHRQQQPQGRLRVSMPADLAELALAGTLADYVSRYPQVTLELDLSPRRVDLIAENYDLAVRMGDLADDAHLSARRLAEFTSELYAAPQWLARQGPLSHPGELLAGPARALVVATPGREARPWSLARRDAHGGQEVWQGLPAGRLGANSPALLLALARAGQGVALAPRLFAEPHLRAGTLVPVLPGWQTAPTTAWAVFPGRRLMPARTRALIDLMVAAFHRCQDAEAALRDAAAAPGSTTMPD